MKVKLPLFSSVPIQRKDSGLGTLTKFGGVSRTAALTLNVLITILFVFLFAFGSMQPVVGITVLTLMVGAIIWDLRRWQITQKTILRINQALVEHSRA